jgi:hypothetical protein
MLDCDWSSDVCSSDLMLATGARHIRDVVAFGAGEL